MQAINRGRGTVLASQVEVADSFWRRLLGLMFRPALPPGRGLLLQPCRQVHTCWMRFPIDVVFLDRQGRVVAVHREMPPGRIGAVVPGAWAALELPAGTAAAAGTVPGDHLILEP